MAGLVKIGRELVTEPPRRAKSLSARPREKGRAFLTRKVEPPMRYKIHVGEEIVLTEAGRAYCSESYSFLTFPCDEKYYVRKRIEDRGKVILVLAVFPVGDRSPRSCTAVSIWASMSRYAYSRRVLAARRK